MDKEMKPVFNEFANEKTLLTEECVVVYGDCRFITGASRTVREAILAMTDLFPELYRCRWGLDVAKEELHLEALPMKRIIRMIRHDKDID